MTTNTLQDLPSSKTSSPTASWKFDSVHSDPRRGMHSGGRRRQQQSPTPRSSAQQASRTVSSGRIERRSQHTTTSASAKTKLRIQKTGKPGLNNMDLDEFFDVFAHNSYAELSAQTGHAHQYFVDLLVKRTTEKAMRDNTSRKAVKDELDFRRQQNGVIGPGPSGSYGIRKERGEMAQETPRSRRKAKAAVSQGSSSATKSVSNDGARPLAARSRSEKQSAYPPPAQPTNFQGHEIYEIDEEEHFEYDGSMVDEIDDHEVLRSISGEQAFEEPVDDAEYGEIREDHEEVEEGEIREDFDDDLEEGEIREDLKVLEESEIRE